MIDIVIGSKNFSKLESVDAMHRLRHRVFKERLDWEVNSDGGRERDEFDHERARYLLAYDDDETLVGTWRLLPTTGRYMLKDTFPQLLGLYPAPQSTTIWETSRFAVAGVSPEDQPSGSLRANPNHITRELFLGLVEYCISERIESVYTVYDVRIARLLPHIGCKPFWQSPIMKIGKTSALAGAFETNHDVLATIRERSGIHESVIRSVPWHAQVMAA